VAILQTFGFAFGKSLMPFDRRLLTKWMPTPVDTFAPNEWGLYDMADTVW
jgi:formylglycine-generating enzyme required for sulfatase activity